MRNMGNTPLLATSCAVYFPLVGIFCCFVYSIISYTRNDINLPPEQVENILRYTIPAIGRNYQLYLSRGALDNAAGNSLVILSYSYAFFFYAIISGFTIRTSTESVKSYYSKPYTGLKLIGTTVFFLLPIVAMDSVGASCSSRKAINFSCPNSRGYIFLLSLYYLNFSLVCMSLLASTIFVKIKLVKDRAC